MSLGRCSHRFALMEVTEHPTVCLCLEYAYSLFQFWLSFYRSIKKMFESFLEGCHNAFLFLLSFVVSHLTLFSQLSGRKIYFCSIKTKMDA
jgi:hypothetical protein